MNTESTKVQPTEVQPTENQPTKIGPAGYPQWVSFNISNTSKKGDIHVRNAEISWGKFYAWDDKDKEVSSDNVNKIVIPVHQARRISSSGRSGSPSGTQGSFDLNEDETKIAHFTWSCPWGSPENSVVVSDQSTNYWVQLGAWNPRDGAIGSVDVEIHKKDA